MIKGKFMALIIAHKWIRLQKKKGKNIARINCNKIRYYYTFGAAV